MQDDVLLLTNACLQARVPDICTPGGGPHRLFAPGERGASGASGGEDSTALAHGLCGALNERHGSGKWLDLALLSIDEGISGLGIRAFNQEPNPSEEQRPAFAAQLNLAVTPVRNGFQNTRHQRGSRGGRPRTPTPSWPLQTN